MCSVSSLSKLSECYTFIFTATSNNLNVNGICFYYQFNSVILELVCFGAHDVLKLKSFFGNIKTSLTQKIQILNNFYYSLFTGLQKVVSNVTQHHPHLSVTY